MAAFTDPNNLLDNPADLLYCTFSGAELEFKLADGTTVQAFVTEGVEKHEGKALLGVYASGNKLEHFVLQPPRSGVTGDLQLISLLDNGAVLNTRNFAVYDASSKDLFGNGMLVAASGPALDQLLAQ